MRKQAQNDELSLLLRQGVGSDPQPTEHCLDDTELAAFIDGGLDSQKAPEVRSHVAGCGFCLTRVGFVARLQDAPSTDTRSVPEDLLDRVRRLPSGQSSDSHRRWRWAVAAAAAGLVVVLTVPQMKEVGMSGDALNVVRDGSVLEQAPAVVWPHEGLVTAPARLRQRGLSWTPVADAIFYEIRLVTADGVRVWDGRAETAETRIPEGVRLEAGQELYVWVRAHLSSGKTLQSEIVGFRLDGEEAPE